LRRLRKLVCDAGHPRLGRGKKDLDGRVKPGHDKLFVKEAGDRFHAKSSKQGVGVARFVASAPHREILLRIPASSSPIR
jgi:hypothetical protein